MSAGERTPNEVRALREAFTAGAVYANAPLLCRRPAFEEAAHRYPMPMVTVPRVVQADGWEYRIIDGKLQMRSAHAPITDSDWIESHGILERTRVINDLLANPTETREAE